MGPLPVLPSPPRHRNRRLAPNSHTPPRRQWAAPKNVRPQKKVTRGDLFSRALARGQDGGDFHVTLTVSTSKYVPPGFRPGLLGRIVKAKGKDRLRMLKELEARGSSR